MASTINRKRSWVATIEIHTDTRYSEDARQSWRWLSRSSSFYAATSIALAGIAMRWITGVPAAARGWFRYVLDERSRVRERGGGAADGDRVRGPPELSHG